MHWATPLIGKPWKPGADGPDAYSCWGLVRWVFKHQHGIDMPEIRMGDFAEGENVQALKQAATASGWRPVEGEPAADDIVLMRGLIGRHVGVMVQTAKGLRFLHSEGYMTEDGPVGSVSARPLSDVLRDGYRDVELWRRA